MLKISFAENKAVSSERFSLEKVLFKILNWEYDRDLYSKQFSHTENYYSLKCHQIVLPSFSHLDFAALAAKMPTLENANAKILILLGKAWDKKNVIQLRTTF